MSKNNFSEIGFLLGGFCLAAVVVFALCVSAASDVPDNIGKVLTGAEKNEVISRNSPLITYVQLSPNAYFPRQAAIEKITIHHMAANLSLEEVGERFAHQDRQASANYAIDSEGKIALYVEEANQAWTSGNKDNDSQAITIEVANEKNGGDWPVSDAAYEALIALCVDICRRNQIESLYFTGDAQGNLTMHKMFAATECPGAYLESRMTEIAQTVNKQLSQP